MLKIHATQKVSVLFAALALVGCTDAGVGDDGGVSSESGSTSDGTSAGPTTTMTFASTSAEGTGAAQSSDGGTGDTSAGASSGGDTSDGDASSGGAGSSSGGDGSTGADTESSSTGGAPFCGDGTIDLDEACDDAGESAACNLDCTAAACGDGVLNVTSGEGCDDGNMDAGDFCDVACGFETIVYEFTGAPEMVVLPEWVSSVQIEAWGAEGGGAICCDNSVQDDGGLGGYAVATYPVALGDTLQLYVGGQGQTGGAAGWNGGGAGGQWGAGGGGASDVRLGGLDLDDRILVAGGGGGGNCGCPEHGEGGHGGGLQGEPGLDGGGGFISGGGGTESNGGTAGSDPGAAGALGIGGGGAAGNVYHVGGGGGGYYGGGGAYAAGGGGGSSFYGAGMNPDTIVGVQDADGMIAITPTG